MERYGWDKYKEEGLGELGRLIESRFFGDKEAQKEILNVYLAIYTDSLEHEIKGTKFYPNLDTGSAHKNASSNIGRLKIYLRDFYESAEGNESDFEIYFAAERRSYRLGIRPKVSTQRQERGEIVQYNEDVHFRFSDRPSLVSQR